jgi:4-aminobutyrate aminotransferase-like enzyme
MASQANVKNTSSHQPAQGSTAAPAAPGPDGPALAPDSSSVPQRGASRAGKPDWQAQAKRHLWMHFTRMGSYEHADVPVIVRGEGCYVYDENDKRYLDGLSALYCVNIGHGRAELGEVAARQTGELGF